MNDRRPRPPLALALAVSLLAPATGAAQDAPASDDPGPRPSVRLLAESGGRADWAPKGDWIAYDRAGADGYSELWVAHPDLSMARCLSCDLPDFRRHHVGNPTWHPSGEFLVAQVERPFRIGGGPLPFLAVPGRNLGDDLWAFSFDGRRFWNLTHRGERGSRFLSPRFAHEGDRLVWSERLSNDGGAWGRWVVRVAEWRVSRGVPRLTKTSTHRPGDGSGFVESYGFTPDDRGVLLGGNLVPGQPESGMDLYELRLDSGALRRLTETPAEWDRFARLAPDGRRLVWSTSRELGGRPAPPERRDLSAAAAMDLWTMSLDGGEARRLTGFNDVFSPEYAGRVMVRTGGWSREGERLLVLVTPVSSTEPGSLYLLEWR